VDDFWSGRFGFARWLRERRQPLARAFFNSTQRDNDSLGHRSWRVVN
jgi:hypothetical protein